jgi:hypothetical protein
MCTLGQLGLLLQQCPVNHRVKQILVKKFAHCNLKCSSHVNIVNYIQNNFLFITPICHVIINYVLLYVLNFFKGKLAQIYLHQKKDDCSQKQIY